MPYMNVAWGRAWLSRNLRGNAPPHRTADTLRAAGEPYVLLDVVVYAGGALFLAGAGGVVFPSCSRGWAGGDAVAVKIAVVLVLLLLLPCVRLLRHCRGWLVLLLVHLLRMSLLMASPTIVVAPA